MYHGNNYFLSVLSKGVVAVLGPQSERNSDHIKAICDNMEIPYIETRPALTERSGHLSSINLHPDPDKLGDILGNHNYKMYIFTNINMMNHVHDCHSYQCK